MGKTWHNSGFRHCNISLSIHYRSDIQNKNKHEKNLATFTDLYLDIIPIKTPIRHVSKDFFFHECHGESIRNFDLNKQWGKELFIISIESSTRWENMQLNTIQTPLSWEKKKKSSPSSIKPQTPRLEQ